MSEHMTEALSPVEEALLTMQAATDALTLARLRLDKRMRDAFPEEQAAVAHGEMLELAARNDLITAVGAYGPLYAGRSKVGYASYTSRKSRQYAEPAQWRQVLEGAGLKAYLPVIITEAVNAKAVEELCEASGQFHQVVEHLITVKLSGPTLRWGVNREKVKERP